MRRVVDLVQAYVARLFHMHVRSFLGRVNNYGIQQSNRLHHRWSVAGASQICCCALTGPIGNTGLGYEIVKALYKSSESYEIIIGCRTIAKGEDAKSAIEREVPQSTSTLSVQQADLCSDESLTQAITAITSHYGRLDVLINNGGGGFDAEMARGELSAREALNATWDVTVSGTHVLTQLAVPLLLRSRAPRVLFMTSGTSSLGESERLDNETQRRLNGAPGAGWPKEEQVMPLTGYRAAKTGLNMLMREWARMLRNDGVRVWAVSPGFLATGLGGVGVDRLKAMGAQEPSVGGEFVRDMVEGKRDTDVGKVIRRDMTQPW
ncbi:NAD(P)-binding protein [Ustulina deusta]|nr:NAD(P)-binding protein [Ustulina deusta]